MSVKLFVETNLDTSVFLLVNHNTEIKQLRDEIAKRLRQTNSAFAEVSVERVKVLFDAHSTKRDRNNCFLVPDDYQLGSVVEGTSGKLFAECNKGKGTKRKREESKFEFTLKKPTVGAGKIGQQQKQPQQETISVSPEKKKAKPATFVESPVLKAPANGGPTTSEKKKNKKTDTNEKQHQKKKRNNDSTASLKLNSEATIKNEKINKKDRKRREAAAADDGVIGKIDEQGAEGTPAKVVKATPITDNKATRGTKKHLSKSAKKREKIKRRQERFKQEAEEKEKAAAAEVKETEDAVPTTKEVFAAKAVIEEAIAGKIDKEKNEDKEKAEDKIVKKSSSPYESDSPTPSPEFIPAAALGGDGSGGVPVFDVMGTQRGSHVPLTQERETSEKSKGKFKESNKEVDDEKNRKDSSGSGSSSSSGDKDNTKNTDGDSDSNDETESEENDEEERKEKKFTAAISSPKDLSPVPSPEKPRNKFHETDLKSLLKKAASGKAGEKANLEKIRADAQKENEEGGGQQKSGDSAGVTTRSGAAKEDFQWIRSHENFKSNDLQKLCRVMVREVINADLKAQGKNEIGPNNLYKDGVLKPDWWPVADFSSKAVEKRESAIKIFNAAREVLSKMHDVKLEGSKSEAAKVAVANKKNKNK